LTFEQERRPVVATGSMDYGAYLTDLAAQSLFGTGDRIGTANYIDAGARLRAARAVRVGRTVSLSRILKSRPKAHMQLEVRLDRYDGNVAGSDRFEINCHGHVFTHMDGLNHVGLNGTWYGGWPVEEPGGPSIDDHAVQGIVTRGVLVDVPAVRGTEWVDARDAVTGEDIDAALAASGTQFEPGDALLLYMGRDKYTRAARAADAGQSPGVGRSGAMWIKEHSVSAVAWDFNDSSYPDHNPMVGGEPGGAVHMLSWAIGLVLVDNCDFGVAVPALRAANTSVGMLTVAPLRIPGGTGCVVNPLLTF
jgi:kynurenine formamidase